MGIALLGLINNNIFGTIGSLLMSYSHSLTSPALFIIAGLLYEKFGTRDIRNLRINSFPLNYYLFLLFLINIGFPGTINFISEIIIFCSLSQFGDFFNYLTIGISILIGGTFFM
jgi:NADH-quinone oxidoreductase subunit M